MIRGIFLGTASIPTSTRNSQGILLDFNGESAVLIDCGEGIQRQILNINVDLSKLDAIYLTHHHIDHVYGVGGFLTLLLNRYTEKKVAVYAPSETIEIVKELVNLFMPNNHSRIQYIEMSFNQEVVIKSNTCSTFKTYHTETSLGYCFQSGNKRIALLGDVSIPSAHARKQIVSSIFGADIAVIDAVHISVSDATSLAKDAKIKQLYLMPILLTDTKEGVFKEASAIFPMTYIPDDLEMFCLE